MINKLRGSKYVEMHVKYFWIHLLTILFMALFLMNGVYLVFVAYFSDLLTKMYIISGVIHWGALPKEIRLYGIIYVIVLGVVPFLWAAVVTSPIAYISYQYAKWVKGETRTKKSVRVIFLKYHLNTVMVYFACERVVVCLLLFSMRGV